MNPFPSSRPGSALLVVLVLGAILVLAGLALFSSTREAGHQTAVSLQGYQVLCLAETALERTMAGLLAEVPEAGRPAETVAGRRFRELAYRLRMPARKKGGAADGGSDLTTEDHRLEGLDPAPVIFTRDDLRLEPAGRDQLDRLVGFMTADTARDWGVKVTVQPEESFRIGPPKDEGEYAVPGVETGWTLREDVRKFLENEGYVSFSLSLPDSLTLFEFSIPVEIGVMGLSAKLFSIDILAVIDKGLEMLVTDPATKSQLDAYIPGGSENGYASSLMKFNTMFHLLLNKMLFSGYDPPLYNPPLTLDLGHIVFPAIRTLWPSDVPVQLPAGEAAYEVCLEKYGSLRFQVEASVTDREGHVTTRRIEGRKEFRVSDLEPPAPMYSLFIENRANAWMTFNHVGGELWVNNRKLLDELMQAASAAGRKVKEALGFEPGAAPTAPEIPGLVRVNFANGEDGPPLVVNTTLLGNGSAAPLEGFDNFLFRWIRGFEGLLTLDLACEMAMIGGSKTVVAEFHNPALASKFLPPDKRGKLTDEDYRWSRSYSANKTEWEGTVVEIGKSIQEKFADASQKKEAAEEADQEKEGKKPRSDITNWQDFADPKGKMNRALDKFNNWYKGFQERFSKATRLNLFPEIEEVSCNPLEAVLCLAVKPLKEKFFDTSAIGDFTSLLEMDDIFQGWESPWFGTEWWILPVPLPLNFRGTTHLFGYCALYPTLTREIEGKVLKKYRQWRLAVVGLEGKDRVLMPEPPFYFPPFPIPLFYAGAVMNKYGYNFTPLQSFDLEKGEPKSTTDELDPRVNANRAPNLYTTVQYAKKASHFYDSQEAFLADLPRRLIPLPDGKKAFLLDGVNYIAGSLGTADQPFKPAADGEGAAADFLVTGRGMIVCSGNIHLGTSVRCVDRPLGPGGKKERPLFTLMAREGGLILAPPAKGRQAYRFEGSLYTDQGIFLFSACSLRIVGNWVTNAFRKATLQGTLVIDYESTRVRSSLSSLHPVTGKFDPARYHLSLSPGWTSWKTD